MGYSYGHFAAEDLLEVGAILTPVEGLILMVLVPWYWPLIGLPRQMAPGTQVAISSGQDMTQAPPAPHQPAYEVTSTAIMR